MAWSLGRAMTRTRTQKVGVKGLATRVLHESSSLLRMRWGMQMPLRVEHSARTGKLKGAAMLSASPRRSPLEHPLAYLARTLPAEEEVKPSAPAPAATAAAAAMAKAQAESEKQLSKKASLSASTAGTQSAWKSPC